MDDRQAKDELSRWLDRCCGQACRLDARSVLTGGVLGLLLSSRHGRSALGKAVKYGAVAGLGALAWRERQRGTATAPGASTPGGSAERDTSAGADEPPEVFESPSGEPPAAPPRGEGPPSA
ncbi:DUF533 domain-containing protein [Modicisalibacter tunisiensis]|uniref:DUF533 domain-containing protein n=1 Tax=Modicisalibacter tunisiensis TaxID=390637 RepID=UPI001CC97FCE|nr:DUF533 domain-containing protein [Modicisalibacter tunisiensis]